MRVVFCRIEATVINCISSVIRVDIFHIHRNEYGAMCCKVIKVFIINFKLIVWFKKFIQFLTCGYL